MDAHDSYKRWPRFHAVQKWQNNIKELGADCAWLFDEVCEELPIDMVNRIRNHLGEACTDVRYVAINILFDEPAIVTLEYLETAIEDKYSVKDLYGVINKLLHNNFLQMYHPILKISNIELKLADELRWKIIRQFILLDMFIPVVIEYERQEGEILNWLLTEGGLVIRKTIKKVIDKTTDFISNNNHRASSSYSLRTSSSSHLPNMQVQADSSSCKNNICKGDTKKSLDSSKEILHEPKFTQEEIDDIMTVLVCLNSVYRKL